MTTKQSNALTPDERMSGADAANHVGLSKTTLERMRCEGRGPRYLRIGCRVFYRRADLDAYLQSCTVETTDSRAAA